MSLPLPNELPFVSYPAYHCVGCCQACPVWQRTQRNAHRGGKFQPPHPISFAKTSASQLISDHRSCTRSFPFARFWLVAAARI